MDRSQPHSLLLEVTQKILGFVNVQEDLVISETTIPTFRERRLNYYDQVSCVGLRPCSRISEVLSFGG